MQGVNPSSRTAATDEDGADHIGTETPRSGVATPQPDLQDKRLPGIMSYFSQVRQDPSASDLSSSALSQPSRSVSRDELSDPHRRSTSSSEQQSRSLAQNSLRCNRKISEGRLPTRLDKLELGSSDISRSQGASHSYPTPPSSQPSYSESASCQGPARLEPGDPRADPGATSVCEQSGRGRSGTRTDSKPAGDTSKSQDATSGAQAASHLPTASSSSSLFSTSKPSNSTFSAPNKWFSLEGLKELTRGVIFKSGPPTPTRALSAAHSSQSDGRDTPSRTSNDGADASGTQTPRTSGSQAPAAKGKLTIKITEARGLRKCRDAYVVAVFQRSELISSGQRPMEEDENLSATPSGIGSIPIQRQGSDSGRPPMAIPMRSRQSSNTSIHDYNTFRNRTIRSPLTNPKWDAEAVLYEPQ